MMIEENKNILLKCDCSTHMLECEYDREMSQFNFAYWQRGRSSQKLGWKDRLRWVKQILFTGNLWADEVILNRVTGKQLIDFMKKELDEPVE